MKSFIEDFLQEPSKAITTARQITGSESWYDNVDEDIIYAQISSPEFRLYEAIVLAPEQEELPERIRVSA